MDEEAKRQAEKKKRKEEKAKKREAVHKAIQTAKEKEAKEKAAKEDHRSLASLVEKLLVDWLKAAGRLK